MQLNGNTVKQRLKDLGMTQVELADQIGVHKDRLNKWVRHRKAKNEPANGARPSTENLAKMAEILGVQPAELVQPEAPPGREASDDRAATTSKPRGRRRPDD
jgi:transcriptional regulator with XRE-family HTH domain